MRGKLIHRIGSVVLGILMLSGIAMLGASTAQAQSRRRVVIAPKIYIGPGRYHRHWRRHWRHYGR